MNLKVGHSGRFEVIPVYGCRESGGLFRGFFLSQSEAVEYGKGLDWHGQDCITITLDALRLETTDGLVCVLLLDGKSKFVHIGPDNIKSAYDKLTPEEIKALGLPRPLGAKPFSG